MSLRVGDEILVTVQGLGSFGEGLARYDDEEIFIPKTMSGDRVKIRIAEQKKGRYRAELIELVNPSPERQAAKCSHFSECGGCDFQHIAYESQMAWKVRMTKHWIRRSPLAPLLSSIEFQELASPKPFGYRHRARLQVKDHKIHFFRPQSTKLLELNECPILVEGFFEKLSADARHLPDQKDWNQSFISEYEMNKHTIQFDNTAFTQGNLSVNQLMWNFIEGEIERLDLKRKALDLFCGIGNYTIPLSDHFEETMGVESFAPAIEWAKKNSEHIEWHCGESESVLKEFLQKKHFFDFVLLDPPRQGAYQEVQILAQLFPPCVIYVSCNIETLIRDLVFLTKRARYKICRWAVADLFPQTHHIESIVVLRL